MSESVYDWILGVPVQSDTKYAWVLGIPYIIYEYVSAPPAGIVPQAMHHYRMLREV